MKYFSTFSGIGGFELGIQLAYDNRPNIRNGTEVLQKDGPDPSEQQDRPTCIGYSEIDKYAIQVYQKHFRQPKTREEIENDLDSIKTIVSENNYDIMDVCYVNTARKETSFIKTTSRSVRTALDDTSLSGVKTILKRAGQQGENIMLCEDNECSICMGEDVSVVESLKKCSLPLNIKTEMDTLRESNMELAICINSPLKNIDQTDTKSCATTVITLKEDTIYAHIKKTKPHKNWGDITTIIAETLPDFDLLVGGFPCQSFSIAGKRGGFEDTRGTMFFELARILRAKQPRLFVFENVKGLLSHDNGQTFRTIITTLDELGYDLQWQVLNSKNHGVPQNRERVFIVGHLRGTPRPQVFPFGTDSTETVELRKGGIQEQIASTVFASQHKISRGMTIVQMNNPTHSNNRVYGTEGVSPTLNTAQRGNRQPFVKVPEATKKGYAEARPGQSINLAVPNSKTRRGRVSDVAQTLDTGMQQHTLTEEAKIRRLTPTECERLQGFPDGWTEGVSDTQRYKCLGNAVTVNVIRDIFTRILL